MNTKIRRMFTSEEIVELIQGVIGYGIVKIESQSTSGSLTNEQLETLLNDNNAIIVLNDKRYQRVAGAEEMQYAYNFIDNDTLTTSVIEVDPDNVSWNIVGA